MNNSLYSRYLDFIRHGGPPLSPEDWANLRRDLETDVRLLGRLFEARILTNLPQWHATDPERIKRYLQAFDALRRETLLLCYENGHHDPDEEEPS